MGKKGFNLEEPVKPTVAASADVELQAYSEQDGAEVTTKPEKAPVKSKVGIGGLFRFATFGEKVGVALGLFFGFFQAGIIQLVPVIIGDTINKYVDIITAGSNYTNGTSTEAPVDVTDSIVDLALDIAVILGVLVVFSFLSGTAHIGLFSAIGERQARKIRGLAFENVLRQDIGFFDKHMGGELNTRLAEDTVRYQNGVSDKMSFTHHWVWMFLWGITYCFIRSWQLTLIMVAMVPVAAFISGAVNVLIKRISQREADAFAEAGAVAEEALGSVRIVAAFAGENKEAARYNECLIKARKVGIKGAIVGALSQAISYMIILIFTAILIWYAGVLVADGEIQPGTIAQIIQCMVSGFRSLAWAVATLETISDAQGAAYGIYELIDHKTAIDPMDDTQGIKLDDIKGQVTFENVHFRYPARADVQVLKGLSLAIQPGQTVALVGPSGCGKSTTIQLLQRYYNQQDGRVCVDGHDVRDLNVRWFRQQLGVVSQDPILFATTVEENIRFGRESATSAEIQACAKEANAHEFIMKLPDGYTTVLNEQSTQLSRGEKQRLSLARALVRKPKILLLDECTSALDNESEVIVQRALEKASKGRTTILIAHRLSTVRDSDNLFVIDKGVVAEYGTHQELLAKQQLYHSLVSTQMSEAKEKDGLARQLEEEETSKARTASFRGRTRARSNSWGSNPDIPVELTEQDSDEVTASVSYRELLSLNQAEMPYLIGGCIGGVIMGGCWPAFAVIYGLVLEAFTFVDDPDYIREQVNRCAFVLIMIGLGAGLVSFITTFLLRYAAEYLGQRIRQKAFSAMLNQEIGWFDRRSNQVGSLTTRLANDASRVKMATGAPLASLCNALSAVVCTIVVAVLSGWQFGLVMLALMPLQTVAGLVQSYTTNTFALKAASAVEESGKIASEAVDKIRIVASLTKEDYFLKRYTNLYKNLKKEGQRRSLIIGLSWGGFHFVTGSILLAALGLGFFFVAEKIITFKAIFTILFCVLMCSLEVGRANAYIPEITTAQASAAKLFHIFDRESQINPKDPSGSIPTDFKGEIELSNVQFFYPTRQDRQVLTNFNLTVHRGQSIAMVGPTGGGKSSVVQLLERFYDASSGKVALDNSDVTSLNTEWLRKQMAIVTQDPLLFSYSIGRNIAYGDTSREVSMAEVIEAAKQANIHNFISSLPLGYDTTVGSKGTQLSGGQKQRVSIARALVRNPKILLLDDATSALDTQSEAVVEEALNNARAGRTCIVISHRLSSIINADLILYVEDGRITEQGTHAQLMAKQDHYYRLQKANLGK